MKLDLENMLYILIYMTFFLSIIGCLAYFCRRRISHETEFILIKNLFLNRFKHSEKLEPKEFFNYKNYDIWRFMGYHSSDNFNGKISSNASIFKTKICYEKKIRLGRKNEQNKRKIQK